MMCTDLVELNSVDAVLEALGGDAATGRLIGVSEKAPWNWRDKGWMPSRAYVAIAEALRRKGMRPAPALFRMYESNMA